jgi:hypothetical protein
MNLAMAIAVYVTISKHLGIPLRFPGKPGAYRWRTGWARRCVRCQWMRWYCVTSARSARRVSRTSSYSPG